MRRIPLDQRRAELIAAAIRVIASDGVAAASTRAIVAEAGMPLGAFHYAFASREELLSAVIDDVTEGERIAAELEVEIGADFAGTPPTVEAVLAAGIASYVRLLEAEPNHELALMELALHAVRHDPAAIRAQSATYRAAAASSLETVARLAQARWSLPLDDLAHDLVTALDGITTTWLRDRDTAAAVRFGDFIARSFAALALPARADDASTAQPRGELPPAELSSTRQPPTEQPPTDLPPTEHRPKERNPAC